MLWINAFGKWTGSPSGLSFVVDLSHSYHLPTHTHTFLCKWYNRAIVDRIQVSVTDLCPAASRYAQRWSVPRRHESASVGVRLVAHTPVTMIYRWLSHCHPCYTGFKLMWGQTAMRTDRRVKRGGITFGSRSGYCWMAGWRRRAVLWGWMANPRERPAGPYHMAGPQTTLIGFFIGRDREDLLCL